MAFKIPEKNKFALLFLLAFIVLAWAAVQSINSAKRKLHVSLRPFKEATRERLALATQNNLLLKGYKIIESGMEGDLSNSILFAGHIYPLNGFQSKKRHTDYNKPLDYLMNLTRKSPPLRIIFGGDNLRQPSPEGLDHLLNIKKAIANSRFILGNHDLYSEIKNNDRFKSIYGQRFFAEDINGVRLIYLHSETAEGKIGLDAEQRKFLSAQLNAVPDFRYALLFLHHCLWCGETALTNGPYENAQELKLDWEHNILPLLKQGRVDSVFSGDGGVNLPGTQITLQGILHFISGWAPRDGNNPPEWLKVLIGESKVTLHWQKLVRGEIFDKVVVRK